MTWDELSPEQKLDMKKAYMEKLADEGNFISVIYGGDRRPTIDELENADKLVPDDVMKDGDYDADDCPSSSPTDNSLFTPEFVHEWCNVIRSSEKLPLPVYDGDYETALHYGIKRTLDKIQDLCDRFSKGQLTEEERKLLPQEKL